MLQHQHAALLVEDDRRGAQQDIGVRESQVEPAQPAREREDAPQEQQHLRQSAQTDDKGDGALDVRGHALQPAELGDVAHEDGVLQHDRVAGEQGVAHQQEEVHDAEHAGVDQSDRQQVPRHGPRRETLPRPHDVQLGASACRPLIFDRRHFGRRRSYTLRPIPQSGVVCRES